jgi:hypothetical protein
MTKPRTKSPGTTVTSLQILTSLHELMKQIRLAVWQRDGVDPKLCRVYGEAVKQYVNAPTQQQLLKESQNNGNTAKTGKAERPAGRAAARV